LYLFAAIYTDTPPHVVERVITPFPCSAISPQRSLIPQYDSCSTIDHNDDDYSADDADDVDDILSQSSISPSPPSPRSDTSLQGSLNSPRDSNTDSSVDGGYDNGDVTSSVSSINPDPLSPYQAYDPTITAYNDVEYVVSSQPSPTG